MGSLAALDEVPVAIQQARDAAKRLAIANGEQPRDPWFRVQNKTDDAATVTIDIYDEIHWLWGVTASDFRNEIKALPDSVTTIDLHVNSPGGDVYEAIAIMNTLRQHDAKVVTTVDSLAASAAGFIVVGASDELIVAENAEIMAHLPWSVMVGDAADMRKAADDLDRIAKNVSSIFAARAGGTIDEWMAILTDETWWSAAEAVEAGIADKVLKAPKKSDAKNSARARFDLSIFNHAGRSNAPAPRIPQAHNQTPPTVEAEKEKEPNMGTLSESALQKLGLDADADEAAIEAAIAALPEEAADDGDGADADVVVEPTIEQVAAVAAKHNSILVDKAAYDQLSVQARDGAEARAQQVREQDDATIRGALASGRITPASEAEWRKSLASNREGTKSLIATLPENKALAVEEVGHGVDSEASPVEADKAFAFAQITGHDYGKGV